LPDAEVDLQAVLELDDKAGPGSAVFGDEGIAVEDQDVTEGFQPVAVVVVGEDIVNNQDDVIVGEEVAAGAGDGAGAGEEDGVDVEFGLCPTGNTGDDGIVLEGRREGHGIKGCVSRDGLII
jgi:hypothetical protein